MTKDKSVFIFIFLLIVSSTSSAAIIQYNDQLSFLADTSATSAGTISNSGLTTLSTSSATVGSLSFESATTGTTTHFLDWTTVISGNELAFGGVENFNIHIAGSAFSLGFDAYEPTSTAQNNGCNVTPCVDSTFTFALYNNVTYLDQFSFNLVDNSLDFVGVHSDVAFNRIEIREISGTNDNEFFGNFLIGNTALTTNVNNSNTTTNVSAPTTALLFLVGLIGFLGKRSSRTYKNIRSSQ